MLVEFSVMNFRSFKEKNIVSLLARTPSMIIVACYLFPILLVEYLVKCKEGKV